MKGPRTINGFEIREISDVIEMITKSPERAKAKVRAIYEWEVSDKNSGFIEDSFFANLDNSSSSHPCVILNKNEWVIPIKLLLESLTKSMTTTMLIHAAARGIRIMALTISVAAETDIRGFMQLDDTIRSGFKEVKIEMIIRGNLSETQKNQLIEYAIEAPIYDVLSNNVTLNTSIY